MRNSIILICMINTLSLRSHSIKCINTDKHEAFEFQKRAIKQWSQGLTDIDLNVNNLINITSPFEPQRYFNSYSEKLSDVFHNNNAMLNFVLIGACDGTYDQTIQDLYWPNQHWQGIFVEPILMNFLDLKKNFHERINTLNRSVFIQAAVTQKCPAANVSLKVPNFEQLYPNETFPHWKRRQIATIIKDGHTKIGNQKVILLL